jgi:hypothetical protein
MFDSRGVSLLGENPDRGSVTPPVKAFENTIFGPRTLVRTWGTRPIPSDFAMTHAPSGLHSEPGSSRLR